MPLAAFIDAAMAQFKAGTAQILVGDAVEHARKARPRASTPLSPNSTRPDGFGRTARLILSS